MTDLPLIPFWFIRHGQTRYNAAGLVQGVLDVSLNDTGRGQAERAGPLLQGRGITSIVSSPMRRARETADIVNRFLHLPVSDEAELREVSFGGKEGQPLQPWFPEWVEGRYTPENAESFAALRARVQAALCRVLPAQEGPLLVVAHGGVLRAIRDLMGLSREAFTGNAIPLYCAPEAGGWGMTSMEAAIKADTGLPDSNGSSEV